MTKQPEIGRPTKQNSSTNNEIAIKSRTRKGTCEHFRRSKKRKKGPAGRRSPAGLPAGLRGRSRAKKRPPRARRPALPAAWRCSTLGEGGLNCRVRDGTGSLPLWSRSRGAPPAAHGYEPARAPLRGDPGGRAAKEATRVSTPRKIPYEDAKSSGISAALG